MEIFHNGEWGTVCDDFWGLEDANVVCRQIGCPYGAIAAPRLATFGAGTGTIWLDNVQCTGSEDYLSDCAHNGWGIENCGHYEDAGVQCSSAGICVAMCVCACVCMCMYVYATMHMQTCI